MSGVNYAYHSYEKPLRTAHSKKFFRHLTPIYIFLGPAVDAKSLIIHHHANDNSLSSDNDFSLSR